MAHISSTRGTSARDSARDRELEITEKFLHPHRLLVHKVQNRVLALSLALAPEIEIELLLALALG